MLSFVSLRVDLEARRNRGRPATSYMDNMDNITSSIGLRIDEVIHSSTDRDDWRAVVAMSEAATDVHGDADR